MSAAPPMLEAEGLCRDSGGRRILADVGLRLEAGEVLGVVGPNGAGKSTLLKLLARVLAPSAGSLRLEGRPYAQFKARDFAARLGYLEQDARVHWPLLVSKVVELGRLPFRGPLGGAGAGDAEAIGAAMALTGIARLRDRVVSELSEGEKMLVALTRLLAARPRVIVADEPVAALDPYHQLLILETFRALAQGEGGTPVAAVVVLHDLDLAARFCDRLLLLSQGRLAAAGSPREVLTPGNLRLHYRIEADISETDTRLSVTPLRRTAEEP